MTFVQLSERLKSSMIHEFVSVNEGANPVAGRLDRYKDEQLRHVLVQYSVFSRKIVSFLADANYVMSFHDWTGISDELRQNIAEEFGEGEDGDESTDRLPHYILLRKGFKQALDIDLGDYAVSTATQEFIDAMHTLMADVDPARVAGGVYALESSARPELVMTYEWTKDLFARAGVPVPKGVNTFFLSHIDEIEILHESRLRDVCGKYVISEQQQTAFENGFRTTMQIMDIWWNGLDTEANELAA